MNKFNIAIDGPSAAGKSTIAKLLARHYGFAHLDTGAMYRCVAYLSKERNIEIHDTKSIVDMINDMKISFDSTGNVFINDTDVSLAIRTNEISMRASTISAIAEVREMLVKQQQKIAEDKGYILDGRDIGTVVLPNAEAKFYLVASVEARAQRRYKENQVKGIDEKYEDIYEDIEKRDYQDMNRETSPLKQADDAIKVDTSNMSIEEVKNHLIKLSDKKICGELND